MNVSRYNTSNRKKRGSALSEFGPALIILFLVGLLPVLDLLGMLVSYGFGWYLNYVQGREAALTMVVRDNELTPQSSQDVDSSLDELKNNWLSSGFGAFTRASNVNTIAVLAPLESPSSFRGGTGAPAVPGGPQPLVAPAQPPAPEAAVTTVLTVEPFLKIPFPVQVPGLNAPVTFSYTTRRPVEDFI